MPANKAHLTKSGELLTRTNSSLRWVYRAGGRLEIQAQPDRAAHQSPRSTEAASARLLCICIDDVGMNAGVCDAVLELIAMDRVHAIGCMVGGAAWNQTAPRLRTLDLHSTDIGLHLDLTEFPLVLAPRRSGPMIALSYCRRLHRRGLRLEIRAQLDRFEQSIGRPPAFVDGHQHVHQLPVVCDELVREIIRRYARRLPWLRSTRVVRSSQDLMDHGLSYLLKPWIIEALGDSTLNSAARKYGVRQNRHLLGVYDFKGRARRYQGLLQGWLQAATTSDLLMCHLSLTRDPRDALCHSRRAEYEVLASTGIGAFLIKKDIGLQPMSQILAAAVPRDSSHALRSFT